MSTDRLEALKIVVSDLHIGTGFRRGEVNLYEDFHDDSRFADMVDFYSTGEYRDVPVELILNGDIFDLLKVDVDGKFTEEITEQMSAKKLRRCLEGHPSFVLALQHFLARPEKKLTYIPGNHDIDIHFPKVRELFIQTIAPTLATQRKIKVLTESDSYFLPDGIQIQHGHQFESMNRFDLKRFTLSREESAPVINLPWGSIFVLRVLNPLKALRPYVDRIYPFKMMVLMGLLFDLRFTLKLFFQVLHHFLRTRFIDARRRKAGVFTTLKILREEFARMDTLEHTAKKLLRRSGRAISTIICGHSHGAKIRRYGKEKLYINTGTWMKVTRLDLGAFGQLTQKTYALIEYRNGKAQSRLLQWHGRREVMEEVFY